MAEIVKSNIANALHSLTGVLGTSDQIVDSESGNSIKSDLYDLVGPIDSLLAYVLGDIDAALDDINGEVI